MPLNDNDQHSEDPSLADNAWSEWIWSPEHGRYYCYRSLEGVVEYQWDSMTEDEVRTPLDQAEKAEESVHQKPILSRSSQGSGSIEEAPVSSEKDSLETEREREASSINSPNHWSEIPGLPASTRATIGGVLDGNDSNDKRPQVSYVDAVRPEVDTLWFSEVDPSYRVQPSNTFQPGTSYTNMIVFVRSHMP
ncbi:uncharacterized protein CTRU02_205011 [Colletotrichum truncatum]|uniref:Uncharacterized protein n=1 Tax=Colletotrichum truncatum TaxID=5467 RepID=A0ACC3Z2U2_COLTU|nr:uncharacterized protein CTRU02_06159 [Colletotrichum truncatum]KAF6793287.1 hypothetical protein CTRU02_06159 [Colletotrichum truncatum]